MVFPRISHLFRGEMSTSLPKRTLSTEASSVVGLFVRSKTNRLGVGKVVAVTGDHVVVEYFHSTAHSVRETVAVSQVERVTLPPQTRCYFPVDGRWMAGRIGRRDEEQYEVDLPNGRAKYMSESILHVRTNLPITDPTGILAIKAHETASYYAPRTSYLRNVFWQSAACRGLTGVLSARIRLLPHQLDVVRRVVEDPVQRYLLADEVGLGKTVEAGCILRQFLIDNPGGRAIVVVPKLLRDQWDQELDEKFDYSGLDGEVTFVAHEEVGTLTESLPFGLAIIDEAQHPAAWSFSDDSRLRRSFARLQRLTTETPRLLLLSATPILHNEREFLAMLHLLSPEMYGLDDVEKLRMSVKTRQEIGRVLVGLQPDRPVFLLRAQIQKLRELLPNDELLGGRLNELSHLLENETGVSESSGAVREVRAHISEAYRLHRRMLRNRRAVVGKGLLLPRWQDGGAASVIEEWDSDERSELALDAVERWRLSSIECVSEEGEIGQKQDIQKVFVLLLQAACSDMSLFAAVVNARLSQQANPSLNEDFGDAKALWMVPLFEGERALLKEMTQLCSRLCEVDRIVDITQIIRKLRRRETGKKIVVFTGYASVCRVILKRLAALPDFTEVRGYHGGLASEDIEDALAAFRDPGSVCDVLVCDGAGEEGRNLQFADFLIHFDLPFNPNRLEQRIGRMDRIGRSTPLRSRIFVGPDVEDSLAEAWYRVLRDGFGVFRESIASLQMFVDQARPELLDILWSQGGGGLAAHMPQLKSQIAEERERVAEQDILDEVESLEHEVTPWFKELQEFDRQGELIQKDTESWTVGTLHFKKRWVEDKRNVCVYRPTVYGTEVPFDLIYADFSYVLLEPVTYFREAAVRYPGTQLLRAGAMFIDKMTQFLRWDDRGQAFAFWRKVLGWKMEQLWTGFVFSFVVEPDLREALEVARQIYDMSDEAAIRRRAEAWFPPLLKRVFVDSHAEFVSDPEILSILQLPFRNTGSRAVDIDLTGGNLAAIDRIIDPQRWNEICYESRNAAERSLRGSAKFQDRVAGSCERTTREWTKRLNTLKVRASYSTGADESRLIQVLDLDMEREIGAAILRGIGSPSVRVDAAGFIVLSGDDCQVEQS